MEKNDTKQETLLERLIGRISGGSLSKLERKGTCIAVLSGCSGSALSTAVHCLGDGKYWEAAYRGGIGVFVAVVAYYNIKDIRK